MEELRKHFRPEFLNRVDDIVVFHPLGEEQLTHIVDLRLKDLREAAGGPADHADVDGCGAGGDLQGRIRPGVRSAAAEAGDPAAGAGPAGDADTRWAGAAWGSRDG